ncbi:MAG: aldo/keto reductase [Flavobacteriaceae bacterium]
MQMNPFSRIISGVMNWGSWGARLSIQQMERQIDFCVALGITSFDHADLYGGYTTEAEFGRAFRTAGINRDQVQLISKCGIQMPCEARALHLKYYDYSAKHLQYSIVNSLKALKTDYLDLLLLHRPSPLLEPESIAESVQKLLKQGKIKSFGVSNFTPSQIAWLQSEIKPAWNQIECSLTHEAPFFDGSVDYLSAHKMGVMAWSPLGSYYKLQDSKTKRITDCMRALKAKYNCAEDQLLLAWLLKHPSKLHPVLGTTKPERIKKSLEALEINLELTDWFLLLKASQGEEVP